MCALSTEIERQGQCLNAKVEDVVVVADVLCDAAVEISWQLVWVGVGAVDHLGGDLDQESLHGMIAAGPTVTDATGSTGVLRIVNGGGEGALLAV